MLPFWLVVYGVGIWVATWLNPSPLIAWLPLAGAGLWWCFRQRCSGLLLANFFFLLGMGMASLALGHAANGQHIRAFADGNQAILLGRLVQSTRYDSGLLQLDLDQLEVLRDGRPTRLQGKLRLSIDAARQAYHPGSWIQFRSRLREPRNFGIPGEFDRPLYLASLGIFATASLDNDRGLVVHPSRQTSPSWRDQLFRVRTELIERVKNSHPDRRGVLLRALLLGDKSGFDEDLRLSLSRSGLAHLFSVSGLHLGLVAGFLYLGVAGVYRRSTALLNRLPAGRIVPLLILPGLWCYLMLSGAAIPTQRAFLMALIGAVLLVSRRRTSPLALLYAVAFLLLLIQPLSLFSPSFQLSVAGLWGISYLTPRWVRGLPDLPAILRWPLNLLLATLAATLCTLPFSLLYFYQASTIGPLLNLLAIPALGLVALPAGLVGLVLLASGLPAGELLVDACGWILENFIRQVEGLLSHPLLAGFAWHPDWLQVIALLALLGALLIPDRAGRRKRQLQGLCMTLAVLLLWLPERQTEGLRLTSFSVGQGESTLLTINGSTHYLIDGGGFYDSSFDVGDRLLAPALGRLGVHSLDYAVLTHNHPDHSLGLGTILAQSPQTRLLTSVPANQLPASLAKLEPARLIEPASGWQTLEQGDNWSLQLFTPDQSFSNLNDRSLVVYVRYGNDGLLLTGDLDATGVHHLLDNPPSGPITLLKLPHHGSRYSDTPALTKAFRPTLAFVSAGYDNFFGLPHPLIVDHLAAESILLYRTDRDGSLQFRTDGHGWQSRPYENWLFR